MGGEIRAHMVLWGNLKLGEHFEDICLMDRKMILNWIVKKCKVESGMNSFGLGLGKGDRLL